MTRKSTDTSGSKPNTTKDKTIDWVELWSDLAEKGTQAWRIWMDKQQGADVGELPIDPFGLRESWMAYTERLMNDPKKLAEAQSRFWSDFLSVAQNLQKKASGESVEDVIKPDAGDRRFKSDAWTQSLLFESIKQSYLLVSRWMLETFDETSLGMDRHTRDKLKFFTKQFVDALSPTNFPMTNPDVIKETLSTGGDNLRRGMENLLKDLKAGRRLPNIRMSDTQAFKLGENIATTAGKVVFKNDLFELLHYTPVTDKNYKTPLLILPPWINKYYILDLRPDNSLVRWALSQGHPVFMVSWVNPTADMGGTTFEDYAIKGALTALDAVLRITGEKHANVVGYCIGGTLLAMLLAYLSRAGGAEKIASATFLTTLLDFRAAGDITLLIDESQVESLEKQMRAAGVLEGEILKSTFNMLRANDLIWSFVINNYLMGRDPFPFDLLTWNSDSTNLPAAMHSYYLRHMYLKNDLMKPDVLSIKGVKLDLSTIKTPCYFLSTREDHIAPWINTYRGFLAVGAPHKTFTLAASGHIAGVVNPPAAKKYSHWTSPAHKSGAAWPKTPDAWMEKATPHDGSWWPHWNAWLTRGAAPTAKPLQPKTHTGLGPAPGTYVKVKA